MIIFDYACMASDNHRRHFIECPLDRCLTPYRDRICKKCEARNSWQPDYEAFYAAADKDAPIEATISIWNKEISLGLMGCHQIWCDIPLEHGNDVCRWLHSNLLCFESRQLRMRPPSDTTPWHELKEKWLKQYCETIMLTSMPPKEITKCKIEMVFEPAGSACHTNVEEIRRASDGCIMPKFTRVFQGSTRFALT